MIMPVNPLPPLGRPLLLLGLAAGATALALWAKRQLKKGSGRTLIRVEPAERLGNARAVERIQHPVEVPWGTELPR